MNRPRLILLAVVAITLLSPTVAVAQQTDTPGPTPVPKPDPEPTPAQNETIIASVGPNTDITDYSYHNGEFKLELTLEESAKLTFVESPPQATGAVTSRARVSQLSAGRHTVTFPARQSSSGLAAVSISTGAGLQSGQIAHVIHRSGSPLISGPFDRGDIQLAGLSGLLTGGILIPILVARRMSRRTGGREL
jgi:hypothetical protein